MVPAHTINYRLVPRGKHKIYQLDYWHNGQHCRRSLKTRNQKIAAQHARKILDGLIDGEPQLSIRPIFITEAADQYIDYLTVEERRRKTTARYRGMLAKFASFAAEQNVRHLHEITVRMVDAYRARTKLYLAAVSMHKEAVLLKSFLRWATSRKLLRENPLEDVRYRCPPAVIHPAPTLPDVDRILAAARGARRAQLAILAFTGMRSGELRHLRGEDVDLQGNWIHIVSRPGAETKTGASRKLPIHPRLRPILEALRPKKGRWLFEAPPSCRYPQGGHWINTKHLNEALQKILLRLELPAGRGKGYTVHSLRHFFETMAVNAKVPQLVVDRWLGHQGAQTMAKVYYGHDDDVHQQFMTEVPFGTSQPAAEAGN
jgi:integrase